MLFCGQGAVFNSIKWVGDPCGHCEESPPSIVTPSFKAPHIGGWGNSSGRDIPPISFLWLLMEGPLWPDLCLNLRRVSSVLLGKEQQPLTWFGSPFSAPSPFLPEAELGQRLAGGIWDNPQGPTTTWAKFSPEAQHVSKLQFPAFLGKARELPEIDHKGGFGIFSPLATFQKRVNYGLGKSQGGMLPIF